MIFCGQAETLSTRALSFMPWTLLHKVALTTYINHTPPRSLSFLPIHTLPSLDVTTSLCGITQATNLANILFSYPRFNAVSIHFQGISYQRLSHSHEQNATTQEVVNNPGV